MVAIAPAIQPRHVRADVMDERNAVTLGAQPDGALEPPRGTPGTDQQRVGGGESLTCGSSCRTSGVRFDRLRSFSCK